MARRLVRFGLFFVVCVVTLSGCAALRVVLLDASERLRLRCLTRLTQWWARSLLAILGLRLTAHNLIQAVTTPNALYVANHQSYLDILIIAAHCPTLFVAKCEVSRWPLLGWLASLGGTIFVERESTHSSVHCFYLVSRALRAGTSVQVFPEGTTSDGTRVLPFKPLLLAAAVRTQTFILPLTINFTSVNGEPLNDETRDCLCWHGEMDFARHFWRLLAIRATSAELVFHAPVAVTRNDSARAITHTMQTQIAESFAASASHERKLTWLDTTTTNAHIAPKTSKSLTA